jgi:hypothetical protein
MQILNGTQPRRVTCVRALRSRALRPVAEPRGEKGTDRTATGNALERGDLDRTGIDRGLNPLLVVHRRPPSPVRGPIAGPEPLQYAPSVHAAPTAPFY